MKQRVLITGGAGYLGGRIAERLLACNRYFVRIGSHRAPELLPNWTRECEVIPLDVRIPEHLSAACAGADVIVHLAAMNEIESGTHPEEALIVNTLGTLHILKAAQALGIKRFLYFSTAHVYGSPLAGVITEETTPRPVHPYAITHRAAEDFVLAAHKPELFTGIVIRLSNGFGAPADHLVNRWTLLGNELCRQAVVERRLTLHSSGVQRRDFITLHDVARVVEHLTELPAARLGDGLFNVGGENSLRVIDMAELIADRCQVVLGFRPTIVRPRTTCCEPELSLDYRIHKLVNTGFRLCGEPIAEIDATLDMCERSLRSVVS